MGPQLAACHQSLGTCLPMCVSSEDASEHQRCSLTVSSTVSNGSNLQVLLLDADSTSAGPPMKTDQLIRCLHPGTRPARVCRSFGGRVCVLNPHCGNSQQTLVSWCGMAQGECHQTGGNKRCVAMICAWASQDMMECTSNMPTCKPGGEGFTVQQCTLPGTGNLGHLVVVRRSTVLDPRDQNPAQLSLCFCKPPQACRAAVSTNR